MIDILLGDMDGFLFYMKNILFDNMNFYFYIIGMVYVVFSALGWFWLRIWDLYATIFLYDWFGI